LKKLSAFGFSGFGFAYFESHQSYLQFFLKKRIQITNGKKHYSLLPSAGHKVLMEVEDVNAVIVGNPQRIIGQQLMPHLIHLLDIIIIIKQITFKSSFY
jgi:hypothetical protein